MSHKTGDVLAAILDAADKLEALRGALGEAQARCLDVLEEIAREYDAKPQGDRELHVLLINNATKLAQDEGDQRRALDRALALIEKDMHHFSMRPCETCRTISGLVGRSFGCVAKVEAK